MKNFETIRLKNFPSQKRLLVLEGGSCQIGIESTVCKIEHRIGPSGDNPQLEVTVLRRGFVTKEKIRETIEEGVKVGIKGLSPKELEIIGKVKIEISSKILYESNVIKSCSQCKMTLDSPIAISNSSTQTSVCSVPCERCFNYDHSDSLIMYSPGMNLTHYSPSIPTYLCPLLPKSMISTSVVELPDGKQVQLNQSIIIDAFNQLQHCQSHVLRYFSLCESSDITLPSSIEEMISNVFHQLHNAEDFGIDFNASVILIYDFKSTAELIGEVGLAAYDRLYR